MKAFSLLLKLEVKNVLAAMRSGSFRKDSGKIDVSRIVICLVAALGILVLAGSVIFLECMLYNAAAAIGMEKLIFGLAVLLSMVMTLLFGVMHTLGAMYFGRDSAALAHLPVPSRAVMAARFVTIYLPEVALSAAFLLPLCVMYGLNNGAGLAYWLRAVGIIVTVPLYPLAISLLLSSILGRMTSLVRNRETWVVIGTILMLVVVIGTEMLLLPQIPEDADALFFLNLLRNNEALMQTLIGVFPPVMWAVHSLDGAWVEWILLVLVGAAAVALLLYLLGGRYMEICLRHTEQGVRRKRSGRRGQAEYKVRSPLMAIFHREMNEVLKTPIYLLNGVLGSMMMPFMLVGGMIGAFSSTEAANIQGMLYELLDLFSPIDLTLILAAMFSLNCWIAPIVSTAVSREGQRLQITRMIPVPARTILNAKLLVNLVICGAGTLVMAVGIAVVLGMRFLPHCLVALLLTLLLSYATGVVSLAVDAARPMLTWKNETQVMKQNMNQMIGMLATTLMMALPIAVPFFLLKAVPLWRMVAVAAILAAECGVAFLVMRKFAEKRYSLLEP